MFVNLFLYVICICGMRLCFISGGWTGCCLLSLCGEIVFLSVSNVYSLLQLNNSGIAQSGQQLSSTLQLQQRNESSLDDRNKVFGTSTNDGKLILPSGGQAAVMPSGDVGASQKACLIASLPVFPFAFWRFSVFVLFLSMLTVKLDTQIAVNAPAMLSTSPSFVRPSRGATSTSNFPSCKEELPICINDISSVPILAQSFLVQDLVLL